MGRPVAGIESRADPCGPGQRYERGSILVTTNLPLDEWTEVFGSERLTRALLSRVPRLGLPFTKQGGSFPPGRDGKYQGLKTDSAWSPGLFRGCSFASNLGGPGCLVPPVGRVKEAAP